ncbi:MAG: transposase [SAR324 cluster bacterium]|nr:transposase [SAR324 cluster bacterium]
MTICTRDRLSFPGCKGRRVEAELSGGDVAGDGGVLLLRQADRRLGLTAAVAGLMNDFRRRASCGHSLQTMLRRRVYGSGNPDAIQEGPAVDPGRGAKMTGLTYEGVR